MIRWGRKIQGARVSYFEGEIIRWHLEGEENTYVMVKRTDGKIVKLKYGILCKRF